MNLPDPESLRAHSRFMDELRFAMYWIPSEQAREFDRWLRLPVRDRELLVAASHAYFSELSEIKPEDNIALVHGSFRTLLSRLAEGGEDVDRLMLWFACQFEGLVELGMRPIACDLWIKALRSWTRSGSIALRAQLHGIDGQFATTYHENVFVPYRRLWEEKRRSNERWKGEDARLGSFDKLVAEIYFYGVRGTPASFFYFFVDRRLNREWWRTARSLLSQEQIRGLTEELVEHVSDTDIPEMIPWEDVIDIDEAFTIDLFPVFEQVASAGASGS